MKSLAHIFAADNSHVSRLLQHRPELKGVAFESLGVVYSPAFKKVDALVPELIANGVTALIFAMPPAKEVAACNAIVALANHANSLAANNPDVTVEAVAFEDGRVIALRPVKIETPMTAEVLFPANDAPAAGGVHACGETPIDSPPSIAPDAEDENMRLPTKRESTVEVAVAIQEPVREPELIAVESFVEDPPPVTPAPVTTPGGFSFDPTPESIARRADEKARQDAADRAMCERGTREAIANRPKWQRNVAQFVGEHFEHASGMLLVVTGKKWKGNDGENHVSFKDSVRITLGAGGVHGYGEADGRDPLALLFKEILRANASGDAVYFCTAPLDPDLAAARLAGGAKSHRSNDTVSEIVCAFIDLDLKTLKPQFRNKAAVRNLIENADPSIRPSKIVDSGNGFHLHWLLTEALAKDAALTATRERLAQLLVAIFHGDDNAKDEARILRVVEGRNFKFEGEGALVSTVWEDRDASGEIRRHDFAELCAAAEEFAAGVGDGADGEDGEDGEAASGVVAPGVIIPLDWRSEPKENAPGVGQGRKPGSNPFGDFAHENGARVSNWREVMLDYPLGSPNSRGAQLRLTAALPRFGFSFEAVAEYIVDQVSDYASKNPAECGWATGAWANREYDSAIAMMRPSGSSGFKPDENTDDRRAWAKKKYGAGAKAVEKFIAAFDENKKKAFKGMPGMKDRTEREGANETMETRQQSAPGVPAAQVASNPFSDFARDMAAAIASRPQDVIDAEMLLDDPNAPPEMIADARKTFSDYLFDEAAQAREAAAVAKAKEEEAAREAAAAAAAAQGAGIGGSGFSLEKKTPQAGGAGEKKNRIAVGTVVKDEGVHKTVTDLKDLNSRFALLNAPGMASIYVGRNGGKMYKDDSLRRVLAGEVVHMGTYPKIGDVFMSAFAYWTGNTLRHVYDSVAFTNKELPGNVMNLFAGLGVTPREGECGLIVQHIKEVICSGNEKDAKAMIDLMAWQIQNIGKPSRIVVILKGEKQQAGKGAVLNETLAAIYGPSGFVAPDIKQVVGDFNSAIKGRAFIHLEEALFGGDRKSADAVKSLATATVCGINEKYIPALNLPVAVNLWISSNHADAAHIEEHDMRYWVHDVSPHRIGDADYFAALMNEIENGGREAFAHMLLSRDVSNFVPSRDVPKDNVAKRKMIVESINPYDARKWLIECCVIGAVKGSRNLSTNADTDWVAGHTWASNDLHNAYVNWMTSVRAGPKAKATNAIVFGRLLKEAGFTSARTNKSRNWNLPQADDCLRLILGDAFEADDDDDVISAGGASGAIVNKMSNEDDRSVGNVVPFGARGPLF